MQCSIPDSPATVHAKALAEDRDWQLFLELTDEQYRWVRELLTAETHLAVVEQQEQIQVLLDALTEHFPGFAPAIRLVAEYVLAA